MELNCPFNGRRVTVFILKENASFGPSDILRSLDTLGFTRKYETKYNNYCIAMHMALTNDRGAKS